MRKTILTILASAVFAVSTAQIASAAEHHRGHKADRAPAAASEQFRNSNAYASPAAEPDWSRYESGGLSAPAGR
jgi:Ni/Co efflux regulator RcnB